MGTRATTIYIYQEEQVSNTAEKEEEKKAQELIKETNPTEEEKQTA
jgi:hypothetical protein